MTGKISGDQVLPRISSNVSVHPMEPDANPMADWMESLEKVRREVPDDVLVLPAHGDCFRGLHARIDSLVAGQERANDRLLAALAEPRRAVDVFGALFSRPISESSPALLGMATGESLACLNHLMHAGLAERSIDGEGIAWYRAIPGAAAIG
jgi:glyoxylase-like metal-dependent hydrolase (beta-lactamase superfamily II)